MIKWIKKIQKRYNIISPKELEYKKFKEEIEPHYTDVIFNSENSERGSRLLLKLHILNPYLDRITERDYLERYGEIQTLEEIMEMDYIKTLTGIDSATLQTGEAGDEFPYYDKEHPNVIHIDKSTEFDTKSCMRTTHGTICVEEEEEDELDE